MTMNYRNNSDSNSDEKESHLVSEDTRANNLLKDRIPYWNYE